MAAPEDPTDNHLPDLRLPVGLFFIVAGLILVAEGIVKHPIVVGIAVDLLWGCVLLVFGAGMTYFGAKADTANKNG